jgi:hypothetical protein
MSFEVLVRLKNATGNSAPRLAARLQADLPESAHAWAATIAAESGQSRAMRGDVITVREAGLKWGRRECLQEWVADGLPRDEFPGGYAVLRVASDISAADVKGQLVVQGYRPATQDDLDYGDSRGEEVSVYFHGWRVRLSELHPRQKSELDENGVLDLSLDEFKQLCEHKCERCRFDPGQERGYGPVRRDAGSPLQREEE